MRIYVLLLCLIALCSCNGVSAQKKLIVLHTNDTHSQIEPLPRTDKYYPDMGGVVNRKALVDSVRKNNMNAILIDAGDFVQGTPYYNMFHGRVETEMMNFLKYDVGTIGNHEFDLGLDSLKLLVKSLAYPLVNCNYDFSDTVLKGLIKPYIILKRDGIKVGIIGVGTDPKGQIPKYNYRGMTFKPITESVNRYAKMLHVQKKCDLIIVISHIGYEEDIELASKSQYVDIIIGGHSHTFMKEPDIQQNSNGKDVLISQAGFRGVFIGEIEVELQKK